MMRFFRFLKTRPRWFYFIWTGLILIDIAWVWSNTKTMHGDFNSALGGFLAVLAGFLWFISLCSYSNSIDQRRERKLRRERAERRQRDYWEERSKNFKPPW